MRSLTLLVAITLPFAIGINAANGQRFGAGMAAPHGHGAAMQLGPAGGQVRFGVAPSPALPPGPHGGGAAVQFGPAGVQGRSFLAPSRVVPPAPRGGFFQAPHFYGRAPVPVYVPPIAAQPYYYAPMLYPNTGIVIIDVPYATETTVVREVAPGVVRQERREADRPASQTRTRAPGYLAPFDPTPQQVVERMLELANVKSGDVLYDLGAGDGRIVIAAAKKYGIKAIGYEIDPGLVKLARENVRKQGLERLVEIRQEDFSNAELAQATVVTLYLSYDGNLALRPRLMQQLRAGARIVSYTFDMAEWQPKISETYRDAGGDTHAIYLWEMGEPLAFR